MHWKQAYQSLNMLVIVTLLLLFNPFSLIAQDWNGELCLDCHDDVDLTFSIHEDLDCDVCHEDVMEIGLEHADGFTANYEVIQESCGNCHEDAYGEFLESVHWESLANVENGDDAAHCYSCHGVHNILPADNPG